MDTAAPAQTFEPSATPSLWHELRDTPGELWRSRELAYQLALRDIRIRYKQSVMGFAWALLMPTLVVLAGALVRMAMAHLGGGTVDTAALAGMAVKAVPWAFFVGAIGFATASLTANAQLITKIYFPRALLPLAATMAQGVDSLIGAATVLVVVPLLGVDLTIQALWAIVPALALFALTAGAALLLSCANLFFRDVKYLVQVFLMFGIFVTPVFFEPAMFGPAGARLMMLNPIAPLLEGLRLSIVHGWNLLEPLRAGDTVVWTPWYLGYGVAVAAALFTGGLALFRRLEFQFAEYV